MLTKKFVFQDGVLDKTHEVELCEEPIVYACFAEDFAKMVQLFRNITDYMDFSQPFRAVVDYDPEGLRTVIQLYEPEEVLQRHSERVRESEKAWARKKAASGQKQPSSKEDELKFDEFMKKYQESHGPLKLV